MNKIISLFKKLRTEANKPVCHEKESTEIKFVQNIIGLLQVGQHKLNQSSKNIPRLNDLAKTLYSTELTKRRVFIIFWHIANSFHPQMETYLNDIIPGWRKPERDEFFYVSGVKLRNIISEKPFFVVSLFSLRDPFLMALGLGDSIHNASFRLIDHALTSNLSEKRKLYINPTPPHEPRDIPSVNGQFPIFALNTLALRLTLASSISFDEFKKVLYSVCSGNANQIIHHYSCPSILTNDFTFRKTISTRPVVLSIAAPPPGNLYLHTLNPAKQANVLPLSSAHLNVNAKQANVIVFQKKDKADDVMATITKSLGHSTFGVYSSKDYEDFHVRVFYNGRFQTDGDINSNSLSADQKTLYNSFQSLLVQELMELVVVQMGLKRLIN